MQEWDIQKYQPAAIEMCHRCNVSPFDLLENGRPRWVDYAKRMAEHEIMIQVMRQFGSPV